LMWGQQYDPETGEKLEKLYNPETGELIENKVTLDSVALPFNSNVKPNLKDISYKDLSKKQKVDIKKNQVN
mgnify:CR=1